MAFHTPLRYPGGKRRLTTAVRWLLERNNILGTEYVEPYAGGAAVAISLLLDSHVSAIHLNDLSRPVYSFWHSVLHQTDELCDRIQAVPLTIDEWLRQRQVFQNQDSHDHLELGLSAFYLNRTNRSGILSGGVIGGQNQEGEYKLDCRFNKDDLTKRIRAIAQHRDSIRIYSLDAQAFCREVVAQLNPSAFVFLDPPYVNRGKDLYFNTYDIDGHKFVAEAVQQLDQFWICTYDCGAVSAGLYPAMRRIEYELPYVAQSKQRGKEIMFLCDKISLPASWLEGGIQTITPQDSTYKLQGVFNSGASAPVTTGAGIISPGCAEIPIA